MDSLEFTKNLTSGLFLPFQCQSEQYVNTADLLASFTFPPFLLHETSSIL